MVVVLEVFHFHFFRWLRMGRSRRCRCPVASVFSVFFFIFHFPYSFFLLDVPVDDGDVYLDFENEK